MAGKFSNDFFFIYSHAKNQVGGISLIAGVPSMSYHATSWWNRKWQQLRLLLSKGFPAACSISSYADNVLPSAGVVWRTCHEVPTFWKDTSHRRNCFGCRSALSLLQRIQNKQIYRHHWKIAICIFVLFSTKSLFSIFPKTVYHSYSTMIRNAA